MPGEWDLVQSNHFVLWLGQVVRDGKLEIRIVPQPGANEISKQVAQAIRSFVGTRYPNVPFELTEKPELDFLR